MIQSNSKKKMQSLEKANKNANLLKKKTFFGRANYYFLQNFLGRASMAFEEFYEEAVLGPKASFCEQKRREAKRRERDKK